MADQQSQSSSGPRLPGGVGLWVAGGSSSLVGLLVLLVVLAVMGVMSSQRPLCQAPVDSSAATLASGAGRDAIPAELVAVFRDASARYKLGPDGWLWLAAFNKEETDFGRNLNRSSAGAIGWMQFMPATWAQYGVDADGDGVKDPWKPRDGIYGAANYLHALGAPGDWAKAAFGYNHAGWYVDEVTALFKRYKGGGAAAVDVSAIPVGLGDADPASTAASSARGTGSRACGGAADGAMTPGGALDFNHATRVSTPGRMVELPAWATAKGYASAAIRDGRARIDSRIAGNLLTLLRHYDLRVHDCLASGHNTHGAGESCDIVPADDPLPQVGRMTPGWAKVRKLAEDLGWQQPGPGYPGGYACNSGMPFKPAIYIVCYNGDLNHGDPAHAKGGCACPHLHLTWQSAVHGAPVALSTPAPWVMVFDQEAATSPADVDAPGSSRKRRRSAPAPTRQAEAAR